MKWFGASWGAPVCDPREHVATPIGLLCLRCERAIAPSDRGFVLPYSGGDPPAEIDLGHGPQPAAVYHGKCLLESVTIRDEADFEARGIDDPAEMAREVARRHREPVVVDAALLAATRNRSLNLPSFAPLSADEIVEVVEPVRAELGEELGATLDRVKATAEKRGKKEK